MKWLACAVRCQALRLGHPSPENQLQLHLRERLDETTLPIDSSSAHIVEAELGKTLERHVFSSRHLFAHEKERPPRERREDRPPREPRDPDEEYKPRERRPKRPRR